MGWRKFIQAECPWCKKDFSDNELPLTDREGHIVNNVCGLVPRRERIALDPGMNEPGE